MQRDPYLSPGIKTQLCSTSDKNPETDIGFQPEDQNHQPPSVLPLTLSETVILPQGILRMRLCLGALLSYIHSSLGWD